MARIGWQKANLGLMERFYRHETCLPASLVNQITLAMMRSQQAWRTLRAENNWHDFAPLLENILLLTKESAPIRSEILNLSPYDVLLDDFIPGIKQQNIDPIFSVLKKSLPDLIQQIIAKQKHRPHIAIKGRFPAEQQKQIGLELMQAIGFDFNHGRLDVSHHPFCGGDPEDVRITTRYNENEFITSAMAICHETGHALDARHGERSEGAYSAVGSDFLPSVSDCKKSLRAVKSFESPCVVEP
ncbi:hypothetical protein [Candidiatus Paracoxiella cheracis]|uniref:hypothetical protein n=1 Tax=Candidiatus Paracoxiella cheracis TaxID=3405120 RepID=UPI003BF5FDFE